MAILNAADVSLDEEANGGALAEGGFDASISAVRGGGLRFSDEAAKAALASGASKELVDRMSGRVKSVATGTVSIE